MHVSLFVCVLPCVCVCVCVTLNCHIRNPVQRTTEIQTLTSGQLVTIYQPVRETTKTATGQTYNG